MSGRRHRLACVAGFLAAVVLFFYGIAPVLHCHTHSHVDEVPVASHHSHEEPALEASPESEDCCTLCSLEVVKSAPHSGAAPVSSTALPLPAYLVASLSSPLRSTLHTSRDPSRAPPFVA